MKPTPSMITWWSWMLATQWPWTIMRDVPLATSGGPHEGTLGSQGVGWCLHHWPLPAWLSAGYLINMACGRAWEHWVDVFLKYSKWAQYMNSYGTTPLDFMSQGLQGIGYRDICYSTKMLQGPSPRSWGPYAFYFLDMHSWGMPLGVVTDTFLEYDFTFNEAMIRHLLGKHKYTLTTALASH